MSGTEVRPAQGKLGVLLPGMGAVATTFIAGVEAVRRGMAEPIGSLTQLAHIRLGKRTDNRNPLIHDFVPLAGLNDLVFGGWDPIPDNAYESALNAGVLNKYEHIEPIADFLDAQVGRGEAADHEHRRGGGHVGHCGQPRRGSCACWMIRLPR